MFWIEVPWLWGIFFPQFNGDILFELPLIHHPLGHSGQLQGMDKKYDGDV